MNAVQEVVIESCRLAILRFLEEDNGYSLNTSVLQDALCAIGINVSRDGVETQAAWLAEQGLVELEEVGRVTVVKITARGVDVATRRAKVPGVKRPKSR